MFLLVKSLLLSQIAFAQTGVRCDFESLTKNCEVFSPNGDPKIMMPDGKTFLPNYSYLIRQTDEKEADREAETKRFQKRLDDKKLQIDFSLVEIFDQVPASKMSSVFKFRLLQQTFFFPALTAVYRDKSQDDTSMTMLWPPDSATPKIQSINVGTFKKGLENALSREQMTKLMQMLDQFKGYEKETEDWNTQSKNPIASETNSITPQRKQRISELIDMARKSVIRSLVGDIPEEQWTTAEAAAVAKVKKVEYYQGDENPAKYHKGCQGLVANALYVPNSNSMLICPNIYGYPDATLVAIFTHEMGHPVDACNVQFPVYHVNTKKFLNAEGNTEPPENIQKDKDLRKIWQMLLHGPLSKKHLYAGNLELMLEDPKKIDEFIALGYIERVTPKAPPITQDHDQISGYVLSDVYNCLVSKDGGAFRQTTDAELEAVADIVVSERKSVADEGYNGEQDKANIIRAFKRFPQCYSPRAQSQMKETMADWYGSNGSADYQKTQPIKAPIERLAPIGFFADIICLNRSNLADKKADNSDGDVMDNALFVLKSLDNSHPQDKSRIERAFLSNLDLRTAMGCEKSVYKNCAHTRSKKSQTSENGWVQ